MSLRRVLLWLVPAIVAGRFLWLRLSGWSLPDLRLQLIQLYAQWHPIPPRLLHLPPYGLASELIFFAVASAGIILLFVLGNFWIAVGTAALAVIVFTAVSWLLYLSSYAFLDPSVVSIGLAATTAAGAIMYGVYGMTSRTALRRSLGNYSRASTLDAIANEPGLLNLSGETRTMTYLVCRLRDFSALADRHIGDAPGLSLMVRRLQSLLVEAVLDRGGTIDHLLPWGLTAFFNAPLEDAHHASHACDSALRMLGALAKLNEDLKSEARDDGAPVLTLNIGINSGAGIAADFGTLSRPQYSATGRSARFADSLSELASQYGPAILVGETTRKLAERNFALLEIDLMTGENGEPAPLFALLGNAHMRASPKFRAVQTFHEHIFATYRARNWVKTRALIEQCRTLSGAIPALYDLYLTRISALERNPPKDGWNGVTASP